MFKMKFSEKRILAVIISVLLAFGIFCADIGSISAANAGTESVSPVIKYTASKNELYVGDTVDITFYFEDYASYDLEATSFQLDMYVDPSVFSVEEATCHFEKNGAFMNLAKYNTRDSKVKTVYFNMQSGKYLLKESREICTVTLKLMKDFGYVKENITLPVTLAVLLDGNASPIIEYNCDVSSPVLSLIGSDFGKPTPTPAPTSIPTAVPTSAPSEDVTSDPADDTSELPYYTVTYIDEYGRIIASESVRSGAFAEYRSIPHRPGYFFKEWSLNAGSLEKVECNIVATAVYQKESYKYLVETEGGTLANGSTSGTYYYDDCVIVTVDESKIPDGKYFAGWMLSSSDEVVSYSKTYSFMVTGGVKVSAVYADEDPEPVPVIVLNQLQAENDDGAVYTMCIAERSCPAYITYVSSGFIVTDSASIAQNDRLFTLENDAVKNIVSNICSPNSKFTLVKSFNSESGELFARAYLTYKDADGNIVTIYTSL